MVSRNRRSFASLTALLIAIALAVPGLARAQLGGAVIIGGDDADDHGSFSGGTNQSGWLFIEDAFNVIAPNVTNGNTIAACIGCNGSQASAAFQSGFDQSDLPGLGWTRVALTATADIEAFFDGTGTTSVSNAGIVYMPTDENNVAGGITDTQIAVVNTNASILNTFVANGGGLFTHSQGFIAGGYGWLSTLIPGITFADASAGSCDDGTLNLTPDGQASFPSLTDAIISNATPWHDFFGGNLGGLKVLVTGPCGSPSTAQPVVIGGVGVQLDASITVAPQVALNPPGTSHTVTAKVVDAAMLPIAGVTVTFNVIAGPNTGATGTGSTDAAGQATFTYTGSGGVGADVIQASFVDTSTDTIKTAAVRKYWDLDCQPNGIPDTCDVDCTGFGGACTQPPTLGTCGQSGDADGNDVPDDCTSSTTTTSTTISPPSTATTTTLPDHYQCYEVKPASFANRSVQADDQFGSLTLAVRFPSRLCAPADKNGEGIQDPTEHLAGYGARASFSRRANQTVVDQFGTLQLDLRRPDLFLVPTAKDNVALVPPVADHFICYTVKRARGGVRFVPQSVTVEDQFQSVTERLLRPVRLCAPADKQDEDPTAPTHPGHLLCYKTRSDTRFGTVEKVIENQFGPDDVKVIARRELCVPALVNPGAPTTTTTTVTPTTVTVTSVTTSTTTTPTTSSSTTTTSYGSAVGAILDAVPSLVD
jgi:hypothetical protein